MNDLLADHWRLRLTIAAVTLGPAVVLAAVMLLGEWRAGRRPRQPEIHYPDDDSWCS